MKNKAENLLSEFVEHFEKTPTNYVQEVHAPLPEAETPDFPKKEKVVATPEVKPDDYLEAPAKQVDPEALIQPEELPMNVLPTTSQNQTVTTQMPDESPSDPLAQSSDIDLNREIRLKKQAITAEHGFNLYNRVQSLGSIVLYDKINKPERIISQRDRIMEKVYAGEKLEQDEILLMKGLEIEMGKFLDRREKYIASTEIEENLLKDMKSLSKDIMELHKVDPNPSYMLGIMMITQPLFNAATAFSHKIRYNTEF
jgi:hypothetical protein